MTRPHRHVLAAILTCLACSPLALFAPRATRAEVVEVRPVHVPSSGRVPADVAQLLAGIPSEQTPAPGEHYPVSNEWRHDLWLPSVRALGGIFVGVGPDQCYTLAAMQEAELAILIDFDPQVPLVHRMYQVLVPRSASPDELVARFEDRNARATRALLEEALAGDERAPRVLSLFDHSRARWARYLRAVRRSVRDGVPGSWLADDALYARTRRMFEEGRIVSVNGDVTGSRTLYAIGAVARRLGLPVRVLYLSNAEQFFPYTPQFRVNVESLPFDERSVILRTFRARDAIYPARDRWHYVVEPALGFVGRLRDGLARSRALELEIVRVARSAPGGVQGLTVLDR